MSWPGLGDLLVWGVQAGWQVLGRPVNIYFTVNGLGYTHPARFGQPAEIYVNPEVLNKPGGQILLQGLILHEIGHHACHFGDPAYQEVCVRLRHKGLSSLLNAVLDEHLERRLRALDAKWGESFDALASHVFKGKDLTISLDLYAALLGFKPIDEAAASLLSGATPGRVIDYEHGYRLAGLDNRWVPYVAFVDMLTADMLAWFEDGKMPEDIAATMRRLRETVSDPHLRARSDGALEVIRQNRLFASEGGEFRRSNSEVTARISVTSLLENPPGTYTDIPTYLACLRRAVKPLLATFPDLKHFVDELDASAHSPWFWNKRNSMLYMMRRSRDYRYAFDPAREMSREDITRIIGRSVFDPVAILQDLIERIRPIPDVNVERPNKIRLAWTELLVVPGSSSYARFFISLRLGLGRQFVGDDPVAAAALAAVSRQLRKLDMEGLRAVRQRRPRAASITGCAPPWIPRVSSRRQGPQSPQAQSPREWTCSAGSHPIFIAVRRVGIRVVGIS